MGRGGGGGGCHRPLRAGYGPGSQALLAFSAGASGADKSRSQLEATRYKKANWCTNVK